MALDQSRAFEIADVVEATGWAESSVRAYITKKWSVLLVRDGVAFRVAETFRNYTLERFREHQSQVASGPPTLSERLVDKAVASCLGAIETYNKPDFSFRCETFSILAGSAWELLLKAKLVAQADEALDAIVARDKAGKVLRSKSGNNRTLSLLAAAERLHQDGTLPKAAFSNLRVLACLRDDAAHLPADDLEMNRRVQEVAIAAVRNFATAATAWFNFDFGQFNMFLLPLSFSGSVATQVVTPRTCEAERLVAFVTKVQESGADDQDPDYSVALRIDTRFVKVDAADALNVRISRDPTATPVRLEEDDYLARFPYTHAQLVDHLRKRYSDFKQNGDFNQRLARLRTEVDSFCIERLLNPKNTRSPRQRFYHAKAIEQFDQFYARKVSSGQQAAGT